MSKPLRIAHISDLHFSHPSYNPLQFFSKRWLGNINLLFSRKRNFVPENLYSLIPLFQELKVDHLIITGDFTTTSYEKEFIKASELVNRFKEAGIFVFTLPGNHDKYTKRAHAKKLFYDYFPSKFTKSQFNLKEDGITVTELDNNWWLITMDTAIATSWISSQGYFSTQTEKNLIEALSLIPSDHQVIVANHFPLFEHDAPRKTLKRALALRQLLQRFSQVKLYLHGHSHRHCLADLRANHLPIILDSGATAHKEEGSWNLIEINKEGCQIEIFKWNHEEWLSSSQHRFAW